LFLNVFLTLLLAHLVADFPLQTDWIFRVKTRHWLGVALHAVVHVLVTALLLRETATLWLLLAALGILHFLCDWAKLRCPSNSQASMFLIDQAVHVLVLALLAWWFASIPTVLPPGALYLFLGWALIPAIATFQWVVQREMSAQGMSRAAYVQWMRHRGEWGAHWIGSVSAACVDAVFFISSGAAAFRRPHPSTGT
jgi:hypothetical protein